MLKRMAVVCVVFLGCGGDSGGPAPSGTGGTSGPTCRAATQACAVTADCCGALICTANRCSGVPAGTGGSSGTIPSRLTGIWLARDASNSAVGYSFSFSSDTYVRQTVLITAADISTNAGSGEIEAERGGFALVGAGTIVFTPTDSSCPGPDPAYSLGYSFLGQNLLLSGTNGAATFAPSDAGPTTATLTIKFGCFDVNGTFTERPLTAVGK